MLNDPQCTLCWGYPMDDDEPCTCQVHRNKELSECLEFTSEIMERMSDMMRRSAGLGTTEQSRLLLQHAGEMAGASEIAKEWAKELGKGRV